MEGVGAALIVTDKVVAAAEQVVAVMVSVTFTVPELPEPQVTVIELVPAPAVMDPPETDHTYVCPKTFGVL